MTKIGPYIIMKAADHPAFLKTEKLARCLSYNDIEEILAHRIHLHKNPKRKVPVPPEPIPADVQRIYNEAIAKAAEANARSTYPKAEE
jgi:hypothetical protein